MDVINEIIRQSPLGAFSNWTKSIILSVFSSIVLTLFVMLVLIIKNAPHLNISFGY